MTYRLGTCGACKARYKIPASFTANRAKCRSCNGVVEIGPVLADEPDDLGALASAASTGGASQGSSAKVESGARAPSTEVAAPSPAPSARREPEPTPARPTHRAPAAAAAPESTAHLAEPATQARPRTARPSTRADEPRRHARPAPVATSHAKRNGWIVAVVVMLIAGAAFAWLATRERPNVPPTTRASAAPSTAPVDGAGAAATPAQVDAAPKPPPDDAPKAESGDANDAPAIPPANDEAADGSTTPANDPPKSDSNESGKP